MWNFPWKLYTLTCSLFLQVIHYFSLFSVIAVSWAYNHSHSHSQGCSYSQLICVSVCMCATETSVGMRQTSWWRCRTRQGLRPDYSVRSLGTLVRAHANCFIWHQEIMYSATADHPILILILHSYFIYSHLLVPHLHFSYSISWSLWNLSSMHISF